MYFKFWEEQYEISNLWGDLVGVYPVRVIVRISDNRYRGVHHHPTTNLNHSYDFKISFP